MAMLDLISTELQTPQLTLGTLDKKAFVESRLRYANEFIEVASALRLPIEQRPNSLTANWAAAGSKLAEAANSQSNALSAILLRRSLRR